MSKGYKAALARVKSKGAELAKGEGIGKAGHELVKYGTHALLAVASKQMDSVGIAPIKPDVAGGVAGALAMMIGKGKVRKLGRSVLEGAVHAFISRAVYTGQLQVIQGPDGQVRIDNVAGSVAGSVANAAQKIVDASDDDD